jgi:hypothetical protein
MSALGHKETCQQALSDLRDQCTIGCRSGGAALHHGQVTSIEGLKGWISSETAHSRPERGRRNGSLARFVDELFKAPG